MVLNGRIYFGLGESKGTDIEMKKLVIFDLDGTLADTLDSIEKAANLVLDEFGYAPVERDKLRYFVGSGAKELIRQCLVYRGGRAEDELDTVFARYQELFQIYCMYHVKPYDGIVELLQALKKNGIKIAVNTNKPHPRAVEVVEEIFGKDYFDCIIGQSEGRMRKPAPDGVFEILDELFVKKEDAIYAGDTKTDMQTGKSAGVFTVGVLWGFRERKELEENNADAIIEYPMQLLEYI